MTLASSLITAGAMVVVGILTFLGTRLTTRAGEKSHEQQTDARMAEIRQADWSEFTKAIQTDRDADREWMTARLAERDRRIDELEEDQVRDRESLEHLRSEVYSLRGKYRAAVLHIRRLTAALRRHADPADIPVPPEEIDLDI